MWNGRTIFIYGNYITIYSTKYGKLEPSLPFSRSAEAKRCNKHQDGYLSALCHWLVIGLWPGYCQCKWLQDKAPKKDKWYIKVLRANKPSHFENKIYAVCKEDWSFVDKCKRLLKNICQKPALSLDTL